MSEKPPSWRQYDVPGDEPGEKIRPDTPEAKTKPDTPPSIGEAPFVPYGDPHASSSSSVPPLIAASAAAGRSVGMLVGIVGGVAGVAVAAGVGIFFLADGDGVSFGGGGGRDMHSQEALDELVADLREEHGTSEVFDATFYPDRAYVDLHVDGGSGQRYESYSWDGSLADWGGNSTDSGKTIDLTELDGSLFDGFCAKARKLVEDPGDCYIIVDPDTPTGGLYDAHVNNEYSEGGYISFDLEGNEVSRNKW
ncbi:hypothetical protein HNR19_000700 [Nocardioides thalensis]|uniref:Uncharacterized protein n=1 Tax=Nocardioides thalensis TaxID=1914755 RepID=A0A853BZV5_9ACTN|nr:hypothetical protein [Nocardioides thalensis]NYJ00002.1 hypothetical protein [Nocardioides thalensis]